MGLFDHITRAPSGLPPIVHDKRRLFHKYSQKSGSNYKDMFEPFGQDGFVIDLPNLQSGWAAYQKQVSGRVLYMVSVMSGDTPTKPDIAGVTYAPLGLVAVTSATLLGELEIADTAIAKGIENLLAEFVSAPESEQGMIPEVKFHSSGCIFEIVGWQQRDVDFWGEIV